MKEILISRKFWVAVLALAVAAISATQPGFELDMEHAAGLAVVVAAYILGVAIDPGPGGWRGVIQSRKFWAALIGFAVLMLDGLGIGLPFELTVEQLVTIAVTIGAYIAGVALEGQPRRAG